MGKYEGTLNEDNHMVKVMLEFKANGKGSWAVEEDNATFKWEVRGEKIWLHTKTGGVIEGKIEGDTLEISLPGVGLHHFERIKE